MTISEWRHYAYKEGISKSAEPRANQNAFQRAKAKLIEKHKIGVSGEDESNWAWTLP